MSKITPGSTERILPDAEMDRMYDSIGRPATTNQFTGRNHFITGDQAEKDALEKSPYWFASYNLLDDRTMYRVNGEGLEALALYILELDEPHV